MVKVGLSDGQHSGLLGQIALSLDQIARLIADSPEICHTTFGERSPRHLLIISLAAKTLDPRASASFLKIL